MSINGYGVVITGAGRGLGAAAARRMAAEGARVVLADVDGASATAMAREIDAGGKQCIGVACDVTRPADCAQLVARAEEFFGAPIDVFVAHAGVGFAGSLLDATEESIRRVIEVNVLGSMFSAQAALRSLVRSPRACLLITGSLQGVTSRPQRSGYTTSKHAIVGLVKSLALEFGPQGVRVNSVAPASTDTPHLRAQLATEHDDVELAVANVGLTMPLGRLPSADDFADAVLFLASPQARSITGHTLLVDCGASAGLFKRG
jgi:3-oxoacyl-[acyl-carrier protein] reductase